MSDPRLTEERLRYYLDGNQPARERMCSALLPILGEFTEVRSRRPKGGPDGARDIECKYRGVATWVAVGFQNGGGSDATSRRHAQSKFRSDFNAAVDADPSLKSFVFFTNVDLTPNQKAKLIAYGENRGITTQVFDLEVLRGALDSREGLHLRLQYLDISENGDIGTFARGTLQPSKVVSYEVPIKLLAGVGGGVDVQASDTFQNTFGNLIARSFSHACVTTKYDDFVFLLSLTEVNRETTLGYLAFELSVHCHIAEFVWALQENCRYFIEGSEVRLSTRLRSLPGDQKVDFLLRFGTYVPHRIFRSAVSEISVRDVSRNRLPLDRPVTTSTLLRLLAVGLNRKTLVWDDADQSPDREKILRTMIGINEAGRFRWDHLQIDPDNPESWEYIGET